MRFAMLRSSASPWLLLAAISTVLPTMALGDFPVAKRRPTTALIDSDGGAVAGLLEAQLLSNEGAKWVERTQIDRILKEQELQAAFSRPVIDRTSACCRSYFRNR